MSDPAAPPLRIEGAAAAHGRVPVFEGVSLALAPGEVFGLIGLNGVGKTTLIKGVLGLGPIDGRVEIFGVDHARPNSRARLAYLPERFQPSPMLTGWQFLSLTLAYYRRRLDRAAAAERAEGLDLDAKALGRPVRTLSKGMAQKLGLVATLLTGQPLLILDEPMSGLDPRARIRLKDRLVDCRAAGHTVFFSSHILADIEEICDRVGILHGGRLVFLGPPRTLIESHGAATLERAFLAEINAAEAAV